MKFTIQGIPRFSFVFTESECDTLIQLARYHDDRTCRNAGGPDGFLFGWKKLIATKIAWGDPTTVLASFYELDIILKLTEPMSIIGLDRLAEVGNRLQKEFLIALKMANAVTPDWRTYFDTADYIQNY